MTTQTRRAIQTNFSAYPDTDPTQLRLNISRSVWNWATWDIIDQSTTGLTLTADEARELIAELKKELKELTKLGN